jgi:hypothetical protein
MAAEDHNKGRSIPINPAKANHSLDDLAKGLTGGTISRLEAVRLLGAALLGSTLASVPGFAWASGGLGPDAAAGRVHLSGACASYCKQNFPASPERAQCLSQGAQGSGPCYECNLDLTPAAGPHFPKCAPDQIFDPLARLGTCCRTCPPGSVMCKD